MMLRFLPMLAGAAAAALLCASSAHAQLVRDGNALPPASAAALLTTADGRPVKAPFVVSIGARESAQLVAANVPSSPATLIGGDYVFTQTCNGYGTLSLQSLGPDGTSWMTLASYTSSDTGSGHGFTFAGYAQVRAVVSGTTGCNALLSRVPA